MSFTDLQGGSTRRAGALGLVEALFPERGGEREGERERERGRGRERGERETSGCEPFALVRPIQGGSDSRRRYAQNRSST